jgi:hypothetical protein
MIAWWRWYFHGQALKSPSKGCVARSEQRFQRKIRIVARTGALGPLYLLSKEKPAGVIRRAVLLAKPHCTVRVDTAALSAEISRADVTTNPKAFGTEAIGIRTVN